MTPRRQESITSQTNYPGIIPVTTKKVSRTMYRAPGPPPLPPSTNPPDDDGCSNESEDEHFNRNEATPLIRHTSRKTESRKSVFRQSEGNTELSIISDCKTHSQSSWSDIDRKASEDDDRSISTYSIAEESVSSLRSLATVSLENFREGLAVPFTDDEGSCQKIGSGLGSLCVIVSLCVCWDIEPNRVAIGLVQFDDAHQSFTH